MLVTSGELREPWATLWGAVISHWPSERTPRVEAMSIESLLSAPSHVDSAMVVIGDCARVSTANFYKMVDVLESRRAPVALFASAEDALGMFGPDVHVIGPDANPATIAGALEALCRRQPIVRELVAELAASRRFQGGLADEISKINEEMQLAANVQQALLPDELPEAEGLEFGVLFRPCGHVSGDIYDVKRLDDCHYGFFLADAVGHGVPAALMTMALRRGLTMVESGDDERVSHILEPADALARLNEAMLRNSSGSGRFATAVYGVIDCSTRRVRIASAGHPAPMRISKNGAVRPVETDGCLLGVFPEPEFNQLELTLDADEVLLIYSDGFETAFPSEEESGKLRRSASLKYLELFEEISRRTGRPTVSSAIETIGIRLNEASGSLHQVDDLTALAIGASNADKRAA